MADTGFLPELLDVALHESLLQERIYEQQTPLLTDAEKQTLTDFHNYLSERVRRMFTRSLSRENHPDLSPDVFFDKLQFHYCDNPYPNAAVLNKSPDGKVHVYVTKGLLERCENEDQLMAIVGHEIGHYIQHCLNPNGTNDKVEEALADVLGTTHLSDGGYRPQQAIKIMERLSAVALPQPTRQQVARIFDVHPMDATRLSILKASLQSTEADINGQHESTVSNETTVETTPLDMSIINRVLALDKMDKKLPLDIKQINAGNAEALTETLSTLPQLQRPIYSDTPLPSDIAENVWKYILAQYIEEKPNEHNIQLNNQGGQLTTRIINPLYTQKLTHLEDVPNLNSLFAPTWDLMNQLYGDNPTQDGGFKLHASILNFMLHQHNQQQFSQLNKGQPYTDISMPADIVTARNYVRELLAHPETLTAESLQDPRFTTVLNRLKQMTDTEYFNLTCAQRILNPSVLSQKGQRHPYADFVDYFVPKTDEEARALFDADGKYNTPQHLLMATLGQYDTRLFVRSNNVVARNDNVEYAELMADTTYPSITTLIQPDIVVKAPGNIQRACDMNRFATQNRLRELYGNLVIQYTYDTQNRITKATVTEYDPTEKWPEKLTKDTGIRGPETGIGKRILKKKCFAYSDDFDFNSDAITQAVAGKDDIEEIYAEVWKNQFRNGLTSLHQFIEGMGNDLQTRPVTKTFFNDVQALQKWLVYSPDSSNSMPVKLLNLAKDSNNGVLDFTDETTLPFVPDGLNCQYQMRNHTDLFGFTRGDRFPLQICEAYLRVGEKIIQDKKFAEQNPEIIEALKNNPVFWRPIDLKVSTDYQSNFFSEFNQKFAARYQKLYTHQYFIDGLSSEEYLLTHSFFDIAQAYLSGSFELLERVMPEFKRVEKPEDFLRLETLINDMKAQYDSLKTAEGSLTRESDLIGQRYRNLEILGEGEVYSWLKAGKTTIPMQSVLFFITSDEMIPQATIRSFEKGSTDHDKDNTFFPLTIPLTTKDKIQKTLLKNITNRANWPTDLKSRITMLGSLSPHILDKASITVTDSLFPDFIAEYREALSKATGPEKAEMVHWLWHKADAHPELKYVREIFERKMFKFSTTSVGLSETAVAEFLSLTTEPCIWNGNVKDNAELYFELMAHCVFPSSGEIQKDVIEHIVKQLETEKDPDIREEVAFRLLTSEGRVYSPADRDNLSRIWVDSVFEKVGGVDDKSDEYFEKVAPYIKKLQDGLPARNDKSFQRTLSWENKFILSNALQDKLLSQYNLSKALKLDSKKGYVEHLQESGQAAGIGLDGLFNLVEHNADIAAATIDYLLQPRTPESMAAFNTVLTENDINLPGDIYLIYVYDNFWSKPFEARVFLLNNLFESKYKDVLKKNLRSYDYTLRGMFASADNTKETRQKLAIERNDLLKKEELRLKQKVVAPQQTEDILNRILPADMPNRETFHLALKNFAEAVDADESYRTEFLLTGCLVAAPKITEQYTDEQTAQKAAEKNLASIIRLFLEAQGPAGIKVGQFMSAQSEVPDYIREELTHLTNHAAKPSRVDAFEILEEYHPEVLEMVKAGKMGKLLGSASHYLTYDLNGVQTDSGRDSVLSFARNKSELKANVVYKRLLRALETTIEDIDTGKITQNATATKQMLYVIKDAVNQAYSMNATELDGNTGYQQMADARHLYDCIGMGMDGFTIDFETMKWDTKQPGAYRTAVSDGTNMWSQSCRIMEKAEGLNYDEITDEKVKTAVAKANFMLNLRAILKGGLFDDDRHAGQLKVEQNGHHLHVCLFDTGSMSTEQPTATERQLFGRVLSNTVQGLLAANTPKSKRKEALQSVFPNTNAADLLEKEGTFTDYFNAALHEIRCEQGTVPPYLSKVMRALGQLSHFTKDIPADNGGISKLALRLLSEKDAIHPDILAGMNVSGNLPNQTIKLVTKTSAQSTPPIGEAIQNALYKTGHLNAAQKQDYLNTLAQIITAPADKTPAARIGNLLRGLDVDVRRRLQHNIAGVIKALYHAIDSGQTAAQISTEIVDTLKKTPLPARLINQIALKLPLADGLKVRAAFSIGNKLTFGTKQVQSFITQKIDAAINQWTEFKNITYHTDKAVTALPDKTLTVYQKDKTGHGKHIALKAAALRKKRDNGQNT